MSVPAITLDPAEVFAVYLQQGGSVSRTALTLRLPDETVAGMVQQYGWDVKVKDYTGGADEPTQADFQRGQRTLNRAINFIQAHRLRDLVDRVVRKLSTDQTLEEFTTVSSKNGFRRDLKPLRDLAEAARVAQELSYRSLGDSMDVSVRDDSDAAKEGKDLQLAVLSAMDAADRHPKTNSADLVRQDIKEREQRVKTARDALPDAAEGDR